MTTALPSGPGGQTRACVSHGVYLMHDGGARLAMVLQPVTRGPNPEVVPQIAGEDQAHLDAVLREIRQLASDRSVFRGAAGGGRGAARRRAGAGPRLGGSGPGEFL